MSTRWPLGLAVVVSAMLGGVVGAALYALMQTDNGGERGALLQLPGPIDAYYRIDEEPFCVSLQHFCLVRLQSGEVRALYTYDTHPLFRDQSCEIIWRPDFLFRDPATGEQTTGWFRANCSGSTFRYNGERVFGPSSRDMDRYPVTVTRAGNSEGLMVDTRRLICGENRATTPLPCPKAPQPE
jgi:hypothetical protein